MAVSINSLSSTGGYPGSALIFAAAGMVQRWRQQTRAACEASRSWRAAKAAEAKRAERNRLRPASRGRSIAHFQVLALESLTEAYAAAARGDLSMADNHQVEAAWFASKARELATFGLHRDAAGARA